MQIGTGYAASPHPVPAPTTPSMAAAKAPPPHRRRVGRPRPAAGLPPSLFLRSGGQFWQSVSDTGDKVNCTGRRDRRRPPGLSRDVTFSLSPPLGEGGYTIPSPLRERVRVRVMASTRAWQRPPSSRIMTGTTAHHPVPPLSRWGTWSKRHARSETHETIAALW